MPRRAVGSPSTPSRREESPTPWDLSFPAQDASLLPPNKLEAHSVAPAATQKGSSNIFYHRDLLKRSHKGKRDDRFLNPRNGRLVKLIVQCTSDVNRTRAEASWSRTIVLNNSPRVFRISHWATEKYAIVRWLPACGLLLLLVSPVKQKDC